MQFFLRQEPQEQPLQYHIVRQVRTLQGAFWTLATTTLCLYKTPATLINVGLSSWFGLVMGLFAVGLFDSLVPTLKEYVEPKQEKLG